MSASDVHVHLAESGALRSISFNPALPGPPPGSLCDQPGVALDDPRIRRAVIGQTVDVYQPTRSEPDHVTFVDADIGAIESKIEPVEHDVYRRVITVALQDRMWTAYLDADTAALIRISANFAF